VAQAQAAGVAFFFFPLFRGILRRFGDRVALGRA
jgi:hypothetical protein